MTTLLQSPDHLVANEPIAPPIDYVGAIGRLDLTLVKGKLCLPPHEGKGWTPEYADLAELWYKRFLTLNAMYPMKSIVPTGMIDDIWHQHILDTRGYMADCEAIFGEYLHHFPYFGLRGPDDAQDLADSFTDTCALFVQHFGDSPVTAHDAFATSCNSGGSGTGCSRKVKAPTAGAILPASCNHGGSGTGCSRK